MLIDWFTVVAQIVNFMILVWFLKRFLYKPILKAVDEREQKITAQIIEAAERDAEAENQKALFLQKNKAFEKEREIMTRQAVEEVKTEKQKLLTSLDREYNALRIQRQLSLLDEERSLRQEIMQKTQKEVFAIVRKLLKEMASSSLEERMTESFIDQIKSLPSNEVDKLVKSFRSSQMPMVIRSVSDLSEIQQKQIQTEVFELFGIDTLVKFETCPDLISGIELVTEGYKLVWSMADILTAAGKYVSRILQDKTRPVSQEGGVGHGTS